VDVVRDSTVVNDGGLGDTKGAARIE